MAAEVKIITQLNWAKGGAEIQAKVSETVDQTGDEAIENVQKISDTSETLDFGDVTDPAQLLFKNLTPAAPSSFNAAEKLAYNAANTIYVGTETPATSVNAQFAFVPQAGARIPSNIATWYAIAADDATDLKLLVVAIQR